MVPGDSRTSVQHTTCVSLTAGFGMRPGVSRQLWPQSPRVLLLDAGWSKFGFASLLHAEFLSESSVSQGPDLNRSVVALKATAWPLRHLGSRVV